jgi:hypothetical protein
VTTSTFDPNAAARPAAARTGLQEPEEPSLATRILFGLGARRLAGDQQRPLGPVRSLAGGAAEEEALGPGVALGAEDEQVSLLAFRQQDVDRVLGFAQRI